MRQNFIADNIVQLSIPSSAFAGSIGVDGVLSGLNKSTSAVSASASSSFQLQVDSRNDFLFSFDVSLSGQDVGASPHVLAVVTYAANSPISGDVFVGSNRSGLFSPLVIGDTLTCSGRCVVPSIDLQDGQSQYLAIGLFNGTTGLSPSTFKALQCRVHVEDIQVFDPLRN